MDSNRLWNGSLHSYRKNHSSTTALAEVTDFIAAASDDKKITASITVDESAAFDSVNHCILLKKLKMYKLHEKSLNWIKNYLKLEQNMYPLGHKYQA